MVVAIYATERGPVEGRGLNAADAISL